SFRDRQATHSNRARERRERQHHGRSGPLRRIGVDPEQPLPPPRRRLPHSIGRYRIVDRLGKGAMGVVYSAQDGLMERMVAIKVMMTDLEDDPETSTRFYR